MAQVVNELIWVPDSKHGYSLAEITDIGDGFVMATKLKGRKNKKYNLNRIYPGHREQDLSGKSFNDNTQLMFLHPAALLSNLKLRYDKGLIYTYTAHILIAVNPYKELPIYGTEQIKQYRGKSIGVEPPHIFAIADNAYRHMKASRNSQSIIVSGESGAGKTETSKFVMKYLASLKDDVHLGHLEQMVLHANPILESFGNAKTVRNKNSSRFGKFTEMHFDKECQLTGAVISHYLLEKSRIVSQNENERNYHVFYELCVGASADLVKEFDLSDMKKFNYLGSAPVVEGVDDKESFRRLTTALELMGVATEERKNIFQLCAAVLHIGAISFSEDPEDSTGGCVVSSESSHACEIVSKLLGLSVESLKSCLTTRLMSQIANKDSDIRKPLKINEATAARDAMAKSIYKNLFDFIVTRINSALPYTSSASYIGVLDIAGFEYFDHNSYEQFCINYCNEKLQGYFNEKVLKQEQDIYRKEGLRFTEIPYHTNDDTMAVIEDAKKGIFALLDEESKLPQANDERFSTTVHEKFKKNNKLISPRKAPLKIHQKLKDEEAFLIRHYAGAVCYETAGFIDKNNDALHPDLELLLAGGSNAFLVDIFNRIPEEERSAKGKLNFYSVGSKFKAQLKELMTKLEATNSQFVRCVKPNMNQEALFYNGADVLQQLHCGGMMEAVELLQRGYPSRTNFKDLYAMYEKFLPDKLRNLDVRTFCEALFHALGANEDDYQFGTSKVFFRAGKFALIDEITRNDENLHKTLISKVTGWLVRKRWKKYIFAAISVQKLAAKIRDRAVSRAILQTGVRAFIARYKYVPKFKAFKAERIARELEEARRKEREEQERIEAAKRAAEEAERKRQEEIKAAKKKAEREQRERERQEALERERLEQERIAKAKAEAEAERQRLEALKLEEDRRREEAEAADRLRREEAEREKREREEEARRLAEQERREREREEREEKRRQEEAARRLEQARREEEERREQERRDHELAVRLAREREEDEDKLEDAVEREPEYVDKEPEPEPEPELETEPEEGETEPDEAESEPVRKEPIPDLSKWSYAQLRDTINTSSDIEMLQACRNEFQKRLKAYYNWKTKYETQGSGDGESSESSAASKNQAVVANILKHTSQGAASEEKKKKKKKKKTKPAEDRFFRIPFTRPAKGGKSKKGLWWAHFHGQKIQRQLETHSHGKPVCLIAGKDDAEMCDLTLAETGLTEKIGAEISKQTFEEEWERATVLANKDLRAKKIINILEDCGF